MVFFTSLSVPYSLEVISLEICFIIGMMHSTTQGQALEVKVFGKERFIEVLKQLVKDVTKRMKSTLISSFLLQIILPSYKKYLWARQDTQVFESKRVNAILMCPRVRDKSVPATRCPYPALQRRNFRPVLGSRGPVVTELTCVHMCPRCTMKSLSVSNV